MEWKQTAVRLANRLLARRRLEIVDSRWLWQLRRDGYVFNEHDVRTRRKETAAVDSDPDLRPDHPALLELRDRYRPFEKVFGPPPVWSSGHLRPTDLQAFRRDNAYVWQCRGKNVASVHYALTAHYLESVDDRHLFSILTEDGAFGAMVQRFRRRIVSRDLLDSIAELYLLDRTLGIFELDSPVILDVGAGYGRLAHRALAAVPSIRRYVCTDGVAESTLLCERYLRYREIPADRGVVVPLDEIEDWLAKNKADIALNIHSFSECSKTAVQWWVELLARSGVRWLVIAPNAILDSPHLSANDGSDLQPMVERAGYSLRRIQPKYADPDVQRFAVEPGFYFVFELA